MIGKKWSLIFKAVKAKCDIINDERGLLDHKYVNLILNGWLSVEQGRGNSQFWISRREHLKRKRMMRNFQSLCSNVRWLVGNIFYDHLWRSNRSLSGLCHEAKFSLVVEEVRWIVSSISEQILDAFRQNLMVKDIWINVEYEDMLIYCYVHVII